MSAQLIDRARTGDVAWLTLNNPGSMNALSVAMLEQLADAVRDLRQDGSVRCVVITGAGKAFCAGGDLLGFQADLAEPTTDRFLDRLRFAQDVFDAIECLPMPVIAAVNGYAIAGGLELLLCCDMVIAAESARIGDGHARYGIIPAGGSSARLPRKIAANRANYMLLSAELMPARTLELWGLINLVVADGELLDAAAGLARSIAQHSPLGLKLIKGLLHSSVEIGAEAAARAEITAFEQYATSRDLAEGLRAFVDKRKPVFTGQ
jgi:enoyl-CoA hydratase/carnithine racemase